MAGEFDINLSNGNILATLYPLEVNGPDNRSTPRLIQQIQTSLDAFVLNGDLTYRFVAGFQFDVQQSASGTNDGTYTVDTGGSSYDSSANQTTIPVSSSIPSTALPYGQIEYTINDSRSTLKLPGKGTVNYGESLIEDLVRMVEHFAGPNSPDSNTNITGSGPAAQPLAGQLWYNTTNDTIYRYDGSQWTNDVNVHTSSLTMTDAEDGDKVIHLTGTEGTLPSPWPGNTSDEEPGAVLWPESNPPNDEPLFRVLSTDATERLRVEHHGTANSGYIRTVNNLDVQSTGESYFYGQLGIGDNGVPTIDRTLTVEGSGIAVNAPGSVDAHVVLDSPTGQASTLTFETQNTVRGEIVVNDSLSGTPLQLNPVSSNNVELVQGGGSVQSYGRVGINNAPPTGSVWLEVTGDIQANSQFFGSNQTATDPTYSFTNDVDTGMFLSSSGVLALSAGGTEIAQVDASTQTLKVVGASYETTITGDNDVPNKLYVDQKVGGISWREPVRVRDQFLRADQSDFPTTGTIDGVTLNDGDRVLFDEVSTTADRDIWVWDASASSWIRAETNVAGQTRTVGDIVYVQQGTDAGTVWSFNSNDDWELIVAREQGGANVIYETQTASSDGQQIFTFSNSYQHGGNNLIVFVNGQKRTLGQFYDETGPNEITVISPSPIQTGDRLDSYIIEPVTIKASNYMRETQTGLSGTPTITFSNITYIVGSENLLVFFNGQKAVRGVNYNEISSTEIDWLTPSLATGDRLEFYSSAPVTAGTRLQDVSDVQSSPVPSDQQYIRYNASNGRWEYVSNTSSMVLDLGDDGSNETNSLTEIATVNDTNSIFTEPVADKLLIDVGVNWPTADLADSLSTGALDAIGEIDSTVRTGVDMTLVTGTAGTSGNLMEWNTDGDAVDSGTATSSLVLTSSSIDALSDVDTTTTAPTDGDVLTWNGTNSEWEPQASSGGGGTTVWSVITSATTASHGDKYIADTSGGAFTITLPASPSIGQFVYFQDFGSTWNSNNLTVDGNGNNIEGSSSFAANMDQGSFLATYNGTQWIIRFANGV